MASKWQVPREHHTNPKDKRRGCPQGELHWEIWQEVALEHPKPFFHWWPWHGERIKRPPGTKCPPRITFIVLLIIIFFLGCCYYLWNFSFNFIIFSPIVQHAIASASEDENYYGTQATFNLWEPIVERDEGFSLAQFWISSGSYSDNDLNTIEAGWQMSLVTKEMRRYV